MFIQFFVQYARLMVIATLVLLPMFFGCDTASKPDARKIKHDLLGSQIGMLWKTWHFASLEEFAEFQIKEVKEMPDLLEYKIYVLLKDARGPYATADIVVVYRRESRAWEMASVTDNGSLKIYDDGILNLFDQLR